MGLNRNLGQLTEVLTESNGNVLLNPNNTVGGTNVYIGQTMATNDNWKIYGNTVALDQGEMVFELGDNAASSSSAGQRFRFYYNPIGGGGTAKNPFILDYNEAIFNANVAIGASSATTKLTIDNSTNANTNHIDMVGYSSSAKGHLGYFANSTYLSSNYFYSGSQNSDTSSLGQAAIILASGATNTSFIDFNLSDAGSSSPSNKMRITSGGDVRINHTGDFSATFSVKKVSGRNIVNFTNQEDADLTITTSEIGAGTKFATITPSVSGQQLRLALNNNNVLVGTATDNGAKLQVNGDVTANTFYANAAPGNPSVDSSGRFINIANGAYIDFPSMSGMIIVNNTQTGAIQAFLCGGGNTASLGFATGTTGSMAHSPSVGGYRFTNNTGSAWVFSFQVLKTRGTA